MAKNLCNLSSVRKEGFLESKRRELERAKEHQLLSEMVNEQRQTAQDKTKGCWSLGHKAD